LYCANKYNPLFEFIYCYLFRTKTPIVTGAIFCYSKPMNSVKRPRYHWIIGLPFETAIVLFRILEKAAYFAVINRKEWFLVSINSVAAFLLL